MTAPAVTGRSVTGPAVVLSPQASLTPVLRRAIADLGGELSLTCGYQLGLNEADGTPTTGGAATGKLIRPSFALLCAAAAGGPETAAVPAAAAIELLHNASLVHDDIMDGDGERRHRPTLWARFGVPAAILTGDALIALGFQVLAEHRHPATPLATVLLSRTLLRVARGQSDDLRFERERSVDLADCIAMITGKTGALLGCACRLGVLHTDAPPEWADRFERFGTHLGVAFQAVDDLLGIWGDPLTTGKPVGSDLRARKKSMPVVAALSAGTAASARLAALYDSGRPLTDAEHTLAAELVEETGGRLLTLAEAERRLSAAWDEVDTLDLDPAARAGLLALSPKLIDRTC